VLFVQGRLPTISDILTISAYTVFLYLSFGVKSLHLPSEPHYRVTCTVVDTDIAAPLGSTRERRE